jgi:hypothetical protein
MVDKYFSELLAIPKINNYCLTSLGTGLDTYAMIVVFSLDFPSL